MCVGMGTSTWAWEAYQWEYAPKRMILPLLAAMNCHQLLGNGGAWTAPPPASPYFSLAWSCANLAQVTTAILSSLATLCLQDSTLGALLHKHQFLNSPSFLSHNLYLGYFLIATFSKVIEVSLESTFPILLPNEFFSRSNWIKHRVIPVLTENLTILLNLSWFMLSFLFST